MAPQTSIPVSANVLGTIGTILWCVQLIPQVWYNWRKKKTEGLPGLMLFLWASCAVPFGVYSIVQNFNIPIQIQPQCFCFFSLVCWAQILIYNNEWRTWTASLLATSVGLFFGAVEAVLIVTLRPLYLRGVSWPMTLVGVLAAVLITCGLLPPYHEIWKRRGRVIGINWVFLSVEWFGGFFSLMALVVQNTFDVLGGVLYIICILLEAGIFISHIIWRIRTRELHKRAKLDGKDFDDLPEARRYQNTRSEEAGHCEAAIKYNDICQDRKSADRVDLSKEPGPVEAYELEKPPNAADESSGQQSLAPRSAQVAALDNISGFNKDLESGNTR